MAINLPTSIRQFKNKSNVRPAFAFAIIYMPDGTAYDGQKHIVTDPLKLSIGAKLEGELFPRVG